MVGNDINANARVIVTPEHYLVGALQDPAQQPRFADIGYFRTDFAHLTKRFPAHLHINVVPQARGTGAAQGLMAAWQAWLMRHRSPGCHLQTLVENTRATRFFEQAGMDGPADAKDALGRAVVVGSALAAAAATAE